MKAKIKNNLLGIIIGVILFGTVGVVAVTTIESSTVGYTNASNNNVSTVEDALNDLYDGIGNIICYNGVCGKVSYRYWNNNFAGSSGANLFDSTHMPSNNYVTRALLEQNYSDFADEPVYIRSILIDGNVVGHESCLWQNNKEFCLELGYWAGTLGTQDATAGANTKIKLQRDIQNALSLESANISCNSSAGNAYCSVGDFDCHTGYSGGVDCSSGITREDCNVDASGSAYCY